MYTYDFDPTRTDMYSDMGAMRLPHSHVPVFDLVEYLNHENGELTEAYKVREGLKDSSGIELIEYFFNSRRV